MENNSEEYIKIKNTIAEFLEYLEANGFEINENGDVVPKNLNKELTLELKHEE